jgi:TonB family protein
MQLTNIMKKSYPLLLLAILGQIVSLSARAGQIPSPIDTVVPVISRELAATPGQVELQLTLNENGYVTSAVVKSSSNAKLEGPCLKAVRQWRYTAPRDPTVSFVQPFRFGGETMDTTSLAATRPEPKDKVIPEVPEQLTHISGDVTIMLAISSTGETIDSTIVKSTHEELNALCLAAAKKWTFKPATIQGRAISSKVYLPFHFVGSPESTFGVIAKAVLVDNDTLVPVRQISPVLPDGLADSSGDASLAITVDTHGYVVAATVQSCTHPDFAEVARAAVLRWKFKPVVKNGVAVSVNAVQPMKFGKGSVSVARVDKFPTVRSSVEPAVPEELKGASGFARVVFFVNDSGAVTDVSIADGSHEAFNSAILDVAKQWTFNPAVRNGVATDSRVTVPFMFGPKLATN